MHLFMMLFHIGYPTSCAQDNQQQNGMQLTIITSALGGRKSATQSATL